MFWSFLLSMSSATYVLNFQHFLVHGLFMSQWKVNPFHCIFEYNPSFLVLARSFPNGSNGSQ